MVPGEGGYLVPRAVETWHAIRPDETRDGLITQAREQLIEACMAEEGIALEVNGQGRVAAVQQEDRLALGKRCTDASQQVLYGEGFADYLQRGVALRAAERASAGEVAADPEVQHARQALGECLDAFEAGAEGAGQAAGVACERQRRVLEEARAVARYRSIDPAALRYQALGEVAAERLQWAVAEAQAVVGAEPAAE